MGQGAALLTWLLLHLQRLLNLHACRSSQTYSRQGMSHEHKECAEAQVVNTMSHDTLSPGGRVTGLTFCERSYSIASASVASNGTSSIHVFRCAVY
jgi:hypothetical protein